VSLTERQRAMLDLERTWWTLDRERDLAIRERFACPPETYYRELNELLDDPDALDYDPLVVRRLRRLRDRRRRARLDGTGEQTADHAERTQA
jgi:hypothetical protein